MDKRHLVITAVGPDRVGLVEAAVWLPATGRAAGAERTPRESQAALPHLLRGTPGGTATETKAAAATCGASGHAEPCQPGVVDGLCDGRAGDGPGDSAKLPQTGKSLLLLLFSSLLFSSETICSDFNRLSGHLLWKDNCSQNTGGN